MELGLGLWYRQWQSDLRTAGRNCNTPDEFYPDKCLGIELSKAAHMSFHSAEQR